MPREDVQEDALHTRFVVARAFATGRLHDFDRARACDELGISLRTLRRDIARAKNCLTIDEWRPKKRGPPKGQRRVKHEVLREVESVVYSAADQKLNVRKLGRDLERLLAGRGIAAIDVPSQSTLERLVHDIEDADPAFFAERRHGRIGRAAHTLQRGSLETSRPLEIVCIDHTVLNARTFLIEGEEIIVRPTFTAVIDLFTSCCLAAFISAFPPSRITVSLAMALMVTPKTDLLRAYGIPGEWEARGLPEVLYVDGAAELKSDAVKRGCKLTGIELRVGWPGRPERRGRMERFWKTTESEIHSWPGTTLGNPQELRAHGGEKPPAWNFDLTQRQVLAMICSHNNETYGGDEIPPIMRWREQAGTARMTRMIPPDPVTTFRHFLPLETCTLNFQGIKLFKCHYRSGEIAKLRYEGIKSVLTVYDPRDVSRVWIYHDKRYIEIPRVYPRNAPSELRALQKWHAERRAAARTKRDTALLEKLAEIRWNPFKWIEEEEGQAKPANPTPLALERTSGSLPPEAAPSQPTAPEGPASDGLPPDFNIPIYKPRVR